MRDKLQDLLAQLRFRGMAAALDAEIERTEREATPASELLYRLLCVRGRVTTPTQPRLSPGSGQVAMAVDA